MTVLSIRLNESGFTQSEISNVIRSSSSQTSGEFITLNKRHFTESNTLYAVHPISNTLIEIDPEQAWFWTPEWLAGERVVDEELLNGEFEDYDSIDDFLADL